MNGVEIVGSELPPLSPDLFFRLIPIPLKAVPTHHFLLVQESPTCECIVLRANALFWDWNLLGWSFKSTGQQRQNSVYSTLGFNHCLILVVRKDFAATNNGQIGCFRVNSYTPS